MTEPSRTHHGKPYLRQSGEQMGNYRITGLLGKGGMAVVFRAVDVILGREVALKVLPSGIASENPQRFEQFLKEAKNAAKLQHPNVVTIYQIDQHEGSWYVAMELVEGKNLKQIIEQGRPLAMGYSLGIITTVAKALAKAHENGILHRDIKPSNIMIGKAGLVKITDFGLATEWELEVRRSQNQQVVGTPAYMAPELCYGYAPSPATDMYALGMTLYVILTNERPFYRPDPTETMKMQVSGTIPNLLQRRSDGHPALQRILERLLAKTPQDRYEWMDEVIADLESLATLPVDGKLPSELAVITSAEFSKTPSVSSLVLSSLPIAHQEVLKVSQNATVPAVDNASGGPPSSSTLNPIKTLTRQTAGILAHRPPVSFPVTPAGKHKPLAPGIKPASGITKTQIMVLLLVLILIVLLVVTIVVYEVSHTQKSTIGFCPPTRMYLS